MGHSVGEIAAACFAGLFSFEDGLKLIATRARLMQALPAGGAMVALFATRDVVESAIAPYASTVSVAAYNGPRNIVVSGAAADVDAIATKLADEGVKSRALTVSHAFHSPLMDPMLDAFSDALASIEFKAPELPIVSNRTGDAAPTSLLRDPDYWRQHVREPVRFDESIGWLAEQGHRLFLEIGPQPTLVGMAARAVDVDDAVWLPSLRQGQDGFQGDGRRARRALRAWCERRLGRLPARSRPTTRDADVPTPARGASGCARARRTGRGQARRGGVPSAPRVKTSIPKD